MTKQVFLPFFLAVCTAGCVAFTTNDPASVDTRIEREKSNPPMENGAPTADRKGKNEKKDPK